MLPTSTTEKIPSVMELNQDMEPYIIQGTAKRTQFFHDTHKPLQFVHFTDMHGQGTQELWDRIMEYINYYSDYIEFALHTGDYVYASLKDHGDMYTLGTPCVKPVLNCPGNHDSVDVIEIEGQKQAVPATPEQIFHKLYLHSDNWGVTFLPCEHPLSYYKDFPEAAIRLIVLDCYRQTKETAAWLPGVLEDARQKGYHVITASHFTTNVVTNRLDVTFQSPDDYRDLNLHIFHPEIDPYELAIVAFKEAGGIHICHLAGHDHADTFGYTDRGVLNYKWADSKRIRGTRTYDSFNVVSVDADQHLLKLAHIGNPVDHYFRSKRALCYDYKNNKVIFNG